MNSLNVKTAIKKSIARWVKSMSRVIDEAQYNVACAEEAYAHYGERFTRLDACSCFIRGALSACFQK